MNIAHRLDEAMRDAKIPSQSELSRRSHVPQATISRVLKGSSDPEASTLRKLAATCGVNFDWLNEGTGPKWRNEAEAPRHVQAPVLATERADETHLDRLNADERQLVQAYRDLENDKGRQSMLLTHAALLVSDSKMTQSVIGANQAKGSD